MTFEELKAVCGPTLAHGPDRVVINGSGEAVAPHRAPKFDIVFVRDDGWSLGAPAALAKTAESLWADQWVGVLVRRELVTYEAWKDSGK